MTTASKPRESIYTALVKGAVWGLILSVMFIAGFLVRGVLPTSLTGMLNQVQSKSEVGQYPLLTQVQQLLNENYLRDQPDQKTLEFAAARGLVSQLNDKYTFLVEPPVAQSESNVLAGKYGGIGVQVKRDEAGNFVLFPFRDGPATHVGVQDSDILLQVNGKDLPLNTQQDAVDQMLRGEVKNDNGVEIVIKRQPSGDQKTFKIVFEEIQVPSVVWRVLSEEPTIGYIQILRFTNRTPDETKAAIKDLRQHNVKSLVLDVRNNPGGLLKETIDLAGQFLDGGVVVYEHSRSGERTDETTTGGLATDLPMVVLVNKDSASAAELLAGALHDRKRAVLIGQQTYGKGSVQLIFSLADQSALHLTTAEWLSPNRTPIDGKGITPDIPMIPDQNGRDVELGEAIRWLRDGKK
ncbi:MAG: S41 family peptidase [Chloroflexota bacterium]